MKYKKDYNNWNNLKKILDSIDIKLPFNEGEIWWIAQGVNLGIEIDGKGEDFSRPALIVKKFNIHHAWIVPLTTTKVLKYGIHVDIRLGTFNDYSAVILTQLQTISNERLLNRIGMISKEKFKEITSLLKDSFPKI